ncbi:hypothetical protein B0H17DRAFT_1205122 [Mycena rosella]|uniref:Extracellular membrane protein CFEM domain-containing protein n=1 Tax=Mycena rosella TaxID=1033263 RepID=A0AAD7GF58_MYCRO|nr:hypothetical protein B0H17DRAFT_1205122 [Mycena rosella]
MYSSIIILALCMVAAARPTSFLPRQSNGVANSPVGTNTGISCKIPQGCFNNDIVSCINGEFVVTQNCAVPTACLDLPVNNSTTESTLGCSTTEIQTALFGLAFGGVENIPTDR